MIDADIIFINVDLPAPFSPTKPCTSPLLTEKETLSSAFTRNSYLFLPFEIILPPSFHLSMLSRFPLNHLNREGSTSPD